MNPVITSMQAHRSIRKFTDQKLPDGLLEMLVQSGQSASSSNNIQAYTLIRITRPELRGSLAELAGHQAYIEECAEFLVFCADLKRIETVVENSGGKAIMGQTEQLLIASVDTALMGQNLAIAAESEGLGVCFIGAVRNHPREISDLLLLPRHVYPLFGMCLGYPAQNPERKPRLPLAAILKQDVYDDSNDKTMVAEYDEQMRTYYQQRSGGTKDSCWSLEMQRMFGSTLRPHMRDFLIEQGFEML